MDGESATGQIKSFSVCMLTTYKVKWIYKHLIETAREEEPEKFLLSEGISVNGNEFIRITFKLIKWYCHW